MTLVGPRPERPHCVAQSSAQYERHAYRHRVKAGLTGLAQSTGCAATRRLPIADRYDNYYIENWSLWLDAKMLVRTVTEGLPPEGDDRRSGRRAARAADHARLLKSPERLVMGPLTA